MEWQLTHCYLDAPCSSGAPLVALPTTLAERLVCWRSKPRTCEKDLGLGIGVALRREIDDLLSRRGFPSDSPPGGSPWLWCLGGPEIYRQPLSEEDQLDLHEDSCVDLNLYVCETHQTVSAQVDRIDAVPEFGGSGPEDPRQSSSISLGDTEQAVEAAMALLTEWLDSEIISPNETR